MDARAGTFQALEMFGQQLLQSEHYASPQIRQCLDDMQHAREQLEEYVLSPNLSRSFLHSTHSVLFCSVIRVSHIHGLYNCSYHSN